MREFETLEEAILTALRAHAGESTLSDLLEVLRTEKGLSDDVVVRMALWPLIAQHKVELTREMTLRAAAAT